MNLKQLTAASLITASTLTTSACEPIKQMLSERNSAGEVIVTGPEFDITPNPHPQKKYTLHVQIKDAPLGGFKRASAWVYFDVKNVKECGYYLGWPYDGTVPAIERSIAFSLKQINGTEYEGTFYTDWGKDGDFFGKGVCHWRFRNVGASFGATGADGETSFGLAFHNTGTQDEVFAVNKPLERFYRKDAYPKHHEIINYSSRGIDFIQNYTEEEKRSQTFSITISVQEAQ